MVAGQERPLAIDVIELPTENPWRALVFPSGHDLLSRDSALLCTMQGDVWRLDGLAEGTQPMRWRRFAAGLHQPLGLLIDEQGIFVQCRDQLVRLVDLNGDGEADFYECVSSAPWKPRRPDMTSSVGYSAVRMAVSTPLRAIKVYCG